MREILVTGGAGFIGSFLCERLIAEGGSVICLDNLQTGSVANIQHLLNHDRFRYLPQDVELPLTSIQGIGQIYNLACPASPVQYQTDPVRTMRTNVLGAINVLDLARRTGARILQASTSEVYGNPSVHPQPETYPGSVNCFGPRACYDEGKRAAEALFHDYWRMHGVDIRIARIFNTYGPRMAWYDGRVISNFIVQALTGVPLTISGDGLQTRSFCYVTDLVDGLIRLMNSETCVGVPCNLGNPEECTIRDLAATITALTGGDAKITYSAATADDPVRRRPDISLARRALSWAPAVSLATGLERTVREFRAAGLPAPTPEMAMD